MHCDLIKSSAHERKSVSVPVGEHECSVKNFTILEFFLVSISDSVAKIG